MSATVLTGQTPVNLGPLTTTFIPPPACTVAVASFNVNNGVLGGLVGGATNSIGYMGQACSDGQPVDATSCWPETSKGAPSQEAPLSGWGFYSPGLHCPTGYATACAATGGSGGKAGWPVQFRLQAGETAVGCCPSGYGCANINGQTCIRIATSTSVPSVTCDGDDLKSNEAHLPALPTITLMAPMIQINWQSSDLPSSSTSDPLAMAKGTRTIDTDPDPTVSAGETLEVDDSSPTNTNILSPEASFSNDPERTIPTDGFSSDSSSSSSSFSSDSDSSYTSSEAQSGLPSSAIVGITVTGAVIVLLAFVFALFWWWRRRKSRLEEREMEQFYAGESGRPKADEMPGWYRGERLATPTAASGGLDYMFSDSPPAAGGAGPGRREMMMPADQSYHRPMTDNGGWGRVL